MCKNSAFGKKKSVPRHPSFLSCYAKAGKPGNEAKSEE